jgi:hypothetical protein
MCHFIVWPPVGRPPHTKYNTNRITPVWFSSNRQTASSPRHHHLARPPPVKGPLRRYAPLTDSSRPNNPASIEEDAPTGSDVPRSQTSCVAICTEGTALRAVENSRAAGPPPKCPPRWIGGLRRTHVPSIAGYGRGMKWWQWVFDGIGGAAALGLLGFFGRRFFGKTPSGSGQSITAGDHSQNIQAGGDIKQIKGHEGD